MDVGEGSVRLPRPGELTRGYAEPGTDSEAGGENPGRWKWSLVMKSIDALRWSVAIVDLCSKVSSAEGPERGLFGTGRSS